MTTVLEQHNCGISAYGIHWRLRIQRKDFYTQEGVYATDAWKVQLKVSDQTKAPGHKCTGRAELVFNRIPV